MPVYLIQAGGPDGPVKIGHSLQVGRRLAALQIAHSESIRLLRTIDGGRDVEVWFHRRFQGARIKGEWFSFDSAMLTVEPDNLSTPPLPRFRPNQNFFRLLINALGGDKNVSDLLGEPPSFVKYGCRMRWFPPRQTIQLVKEANRRSFGVPQEFLREIGLGPPSSRKAPVERRWPLGEWRPSTEES